MRRTLSYLLSASLAISGITAGFAPAAAVPFTPTMSEPGAMTVQVASKRYLRHRNALLRERAETRSDALRERAETRSNALLDRAETRSNALLDRAETRADALRFRDKRRHYSAGRNYSRFKWDGRYYAYRYRYRGSNGY